MSVRARKVVAVAAMLAGAMAKPANHAAVRGPWPPPRERTGAESRAEGASGSGEGDGTCALPGDTMAEFSAMCYERKWALANEGCSDDGTSRFVLTMGAEQAEGRSEVERKGEVVGGGVVQRVV